MATAKSDERIRAEQMYRDSKGTMKLVEIAAQLGVSPSKVRKWKSLDTWDKNVKPAREKQMVRSTNSRGNAPPQKKPGAPSGNKNAVGNNGGAPLRNQNATKHGIYREPFADILKGRDMEVYDAIVTNGINEEDSLIEKIALFTVRERWLLGKIQNFSKQDRESSGLIVSEVNRTDIARNMLKDSGTEQTTSTRTVNNTELLFKAHAELTKVQEQNRRCIEALHRLRQAGKETKSNSVANDWITALIGGDGDV